MISTKLFRLFFLHFAGLTLFLAVQSQDTFFKEYGGPSIEHGYHGTATNDGGYACVGYTESLENGDRDIYVVRTDGLGDTLWTKTYGGSMRDMGFSIHETNDNGFIISGFTSSFGEGESDVYIIKTDSHGDTIWTKTYGGPGRDTGFSVDVLTNGYIVSGRITDTTSGREEVALLRLDLAGDTLWTRTYGSPGTGLGRSVKTTSDNGFIVGGVHFDEFGVRRAYLIKTDANGNESWSKKIDGISPDFWDVQQIQDGYLATGGDGGTGILYKSSDDGSKRWFQVYSGSNGPLFLMASTENSADTSYVVCGYETNTLGQSFVIIKTDTSGVEETRKNYPQGDWARTITATNDNGFAVMGTSSIVLSDTNYQLCILKLDSNLCLTTISISTISGDESVCDGQTASLSSGISADQYLWSNGMTDSSIIVDQPGNYSLIITTQDGCVGISDTITIENTTPIPILIVKSDTIFCAGDSLELASRITNYDPEGSYSYIWSGVVGAPDDSSVMVRTSGLISCTVKELNSGCENTTREAEVLVRSPFDSLNICLVSLDTVTRKNAIIFERPENKGIDYFRIYREASLGGFEEIATLPYDELSYWIDNTSQPDIKSHKYRISVIDSCGNESGTGNYHKTMLLTTSLGPDRINLQWTEYEVEKSGIGFIGYIIYRGSSPRSLQPIDSIPSDNTIYPDINPPPGTNYYLVAGVKEGACYPSGVFKEGTGPYSHSLSNMDDNKIRETGIHKTRSSGLRIFPNPSDGPVTIHFSNPDNSSYSLIITDISGKHVLRINEIREESLLLEKGILSKGYYLIQLEGRLSLRGRLIIK